MSSFEQLSKWWDQRDASFFKQHLDRYAHIRQPFHDECRGEFWSLGEHDKDRRRIILWRLAPGHPEYAQYKEQVFKMPFLADETVEDRDDILLPLIDRVMQDEHARGNI